MDPHLYEGKVLNIEGEDQLIPEFSRWNKICSIPGCRVAYFPEIKKYFINQWECNILQPSIIMVLYLLSFIAGVWSTFDTLSKTNRIITIVFFSLSYGLFLTSYFMAMCMSPGYLPFYWAIEKRHKYTYEEQMDGIITTDEQFDFAYRNSRPQRGALSTQGRRIVLRADHVCKWIANWVGYKNHRYFLLQLFWTLPVFLIFIILAILEAIKMKEHWKPTPPQIMMMVLILPDVGFMGFYFTILARHVRYLFTNDTTLGEFKRISDNTSENIYDIGCLKNVETVMGPIAFCPLYLCPFPLPRTGDGFKFETNNNIDYEVEEEFPPITLEMVAKAPTKDEYLEQKRQRQILALRTLQTRSPNVRIRHNIRVAQPKMEPVGDALMADLDDPSELSESFDA